MANQYPPDWVQMQSPQWPETDVTPDGVHYTSDARGKVWVRPYHVQALMVKDGYSIVHPDVADAFSDHISKAQQRNYGVDPDALSATLAKAATAAVNTPPATTAVVQSEPASVDSSKPSK